MESFDILSLDGGGTWALVQARILQEKYGKDTTGHTVLKDFDLVIANSGGSLVLAALCADKKLADICDIFTNVNILKTIFDRKHTLPTLLGLQLYDTDSKFNGLKAVLGPYSTVTMDQLPGRIGKSSLQIIITGFDYNRERATYFRSNKLSKMESGNIEELVAGQQPTGSEYQAVTLLDAIHASSNAPVTFFDKPAKVKVGNHTKDRLFWDGAVGGNNNPVTSGLLEALANDVPMEKIRIISIGTANTVLPVLYGEDGEPEYDESFLVTISRMPENTVKGEIADVKKMATAVIADPPDTATFNAHQIMRLNYKESVPRLIRINPLVKPLYDHANVKWIAPGAGWETDDTRELFTMDMAVTDERGVGLINLLCDDFFLGQFDNQGIRIGGTRLQAIIGHKTYAAAMADWNKWSTTPPENLS
ncbi:MAG: patatin [Bacteroidetes bacterium]|nr:patatin [Bacteroidota bacterium]